jgi:hypothetical protein
VAFCVKPEVVLSMDLSYIVAIGITIMVFSFLSGFSVGGYLIFLALAWWTYFLFNFNNTK